MSNVHRINDAFDIIYKTFIQRIIRSRPLSHPSSPSHSIRRSSFSDWAPPGPKASPCINRTWSPRRASIPWSAWKTHTPASVSRCRSTKRAGRLAVAVVRTQPQHFAPVASHSLRTSVSPTASALTHRLRHHRHRHNSTVASGRPASTERRRRRRRIRHSQLHDQRTRRSPSKSGLSGDATAGR